MQFTSIPFFIFIFVVATLYYLIPHRYRNWLLLLASYYFYFSIQPEYLVLLMVSTLTNYLVGRGFERFPKKKNRLLSVALVFNLGILFFFKYFNFFGEQLNIVFSTVSLNLKIPQHSLILPIGISFYTFMALGYILDVYWGDIKAQKNLLTFSVYLAFFPQILSGPIGRAKNLFKQFEEKHFLLYDNFANGFRLILWGMFKKMVVADNIGVYVDAVYAYIPMHSSLTLLITMLIYPLQLYADFSGYTDIARGVAKVFGFNLAVNFQTPYINSTSVTEFWRRNHISLTSWLTDYIFYPFMGMSSKKSKVYLGILLTFLASGIWHGVGWMFVIWGVLQALLLIIEDVIGWDKLFRKNKIASVLKRISTYVLMAVGLVFFRLPDLNNVSTFIKTLKNITWAYYIGTKEAILPIVLSVPILIIFELLQDKNQIDVFVKNKSLYFRWVFYISIIFTILFLGNLNNTSFIYYEF